ncbi:MAG: hypothetical protein LBK68_04575 [Candidatus Margulisbacteria bacterium]|jgi:hypothetical protein|nr:hypothetical protein [Candidatus Margulisiibacteriota bacterium]
MASIPKKIHYCWLSGEPMPKDILRYMQTWQDKMPDYELVLWDKNKFDIDSVAFVREACAAKKFASASDYIRAYALYSEGGIYLDTDVIVKKSFSEFLGAGFFTAVQYSPDIVAERQQNIADLLTADGRLKNNLDAAIVCVPGICLQPEIMGGAAGHPYLKDVLSWYENRPFRSQGLTYTETCAAPDVYTTIATKHGFHYKNELQFFGQDMVVYPFPIFVGNLKYATKESYAVHLGTGGGVGLNLSERLRKKIRLNKFLRKLAGHKTVDDILKM